MKFEIPESLRLNHKQLRVALQMASVAGGKTGVARKLAKPLQPHTADADTADLFTEISRGIDKWLWFVEAHCQSTK